MAGRPVPLTVVIPTLDEGAQIAECVRRLAWADEVIVADAGSTDDTVAARAPGGCDGARADRSDHRRAAERSHRAGAERWIFALDADERVSDIAARRAGRGPARSGASGLSGPAAELLPGARAHPGPLGQGLGHPAVHQRPAFRRRRVHEGLEPGADPGRLAVPCGTSPTATWGTRSRRCTATPAGERKTCSTGASAPASGIWGPPVGRFLRAYLLQGGVLDGRFGFVTSVLGGYTAFLKYAHLWELERRG